MADIKITLATPPAVSAPGATASPATPLAAKPAAPVAPLAASAAVKSASSPAAPSPLAAPPPAVKPPSTFKDLFSKTAEKAGAPKLLETITGKTSIADKLKPILGSSPQLKKTLEQEKEHRQKQMLRTSQIAFVVAILLALGSVFYFYSELDPSFNLFGPNLTARLNETNTNLRALQTTINKYRYLAAQLDLNSFSLAAEQYLDKTSKLDDPDVSAEDKSALEKEVFALQTSLPAILESLRKNMIQDITVKTYGADESVPVDEAAYRAQFEEDLRASLTEYRASLSQGQDGAAADPQELKFVDNTIKLVGNNLLIGTLRSTPITEFKKQLENYATSQDPTQRGSLQALFSTILSSTSSDIATIGSLKASRISWATVIKQIETVTAEVDANFGKGVYATKGGITYTTYTFDQQSGKISISGETKTDDAKNFTLMSELIETVEASPYFKEVAMRSFTKSGSPEAKYTASFTLNFSLETGGTAQDNATVSLGGDMLKTRTGAKKIRRMP